MKTDIDLTRLADQANRIFISPSNLYPWSDIMRGCSVLSESGFLRKYKAVDKNTFRALHRKDKSKPVGETFVRYFVDTIYRSHQTGNRSVPTEAIFSIR